MKPYKAISAVLIVSVALSLLPVGFQRDDASGSIVPLEVKQAHAVPVAVPGAAFIAECAAAAGISAGDLVATVVGISTVSTGMAFGYDQGVKMGSDLTSNLNNLIEAADYPPYDTLSEQDQQSWGSKENYDAAKFNSLLDAFGIGEDRDSFYSSGGANFEFSENVKDRLEQLGRIGSNWANGAANTVNDLLASLSEGHEQVFQQYYGVSQYEEVNGTDYTEWPENFPATVYVNKGNYFRIDQVYSTQNNVLQRASGRDIYWVIFFNERQWHSVLFSKEPFMYGSRSDAASEQGVPAVSLTGTSQEKTINGNTFYYVDLETTRRGSYSNPTMQITNITYAQTSYDKFEKMCEQILYGQNLAIGEMPIDVAGYPQDISQDGEKPIYYPNDGITDSVTWDDYEVPTINVPGADLSTIEGILQKLKFDSDSCLQVYDHHIYSFLVGMKTDVTKLMGDIKQILQNLKFDNSMNLNVYDGNVYNMLLQIRELLNQSKYNDGNFKVHDLGVFDNLTDIQSSLLEIITILKTPDVNDLVGDFDFDQLKQNSEDIVDRLSELAPFGAFALIASMLAIWTGVYQINDPSFTVPFNFADSGNVVINLSWLSDLQPVIDFFMISLLIWCLANASMRMIEREAAS